MVKFVWLPAEDGGSVIPVNPELVQYVRPAPDRADGAPRSMLIFESSAGHLNYVLVQASVPDGVSMLLGEASPRKPADAGPGAGAEAASEGGVVDEAEEPAPPVHEARDDRADAIRYAAEARLTLEDGSPAFDEEGEGDGNGDDEAGGRKHKRRKD